MSGAGRSLHQSDTCNLPNTRCLTHPPHTVNKSLWAVQVLLALAFGMAGAFKLFQPIADLAAQMGWPGETSPLVIRFIGLSELAGALGLILPGVLRIRPSLTQLAASGLVVVMVLALGFHLVRGEIAEALPSLVLGALAAFVAWGRSQKAPLAARA